MVEAKKFQRFQKIVPPRSNLLFLVSLILLASTAYLGRQVYEMKKPALSAEASVRKLVADVSEAIILPQDELPTVAQVADASQLAHEPFFANAETGDTILIFEKNKKAILWRPSIRKVVEVSSLQSSTTPR